MARSKTNALAQRGKTLEERFWQYVSRGGPNECWLWTGCKAGGTKKPQDQRHGVIRGSQKGPGIPGKLYKAHVVAYALAHGISPDDAPQTIHICWNYLCCNAAHIQSVQDNAEAAGRKQKAGRYRKGIRWYKRKGQKVQPSDLPRIRQMRKNGLKICEIAKVLGVSSQAVVHYLQGRRLGISR